MLQLRIHFSEEQKQEMQVQHSNFSTHKKEEWSQEESLCDGKSGNAVGV